MSSLNPHESENSWMGTHYAALFVAIFATVAEVSLAAGAAADGVLLRPEMLAILGFIGAVDFAAAVWAVPAALDLFGKW